MLSRYQSDFIIRGIGGGGFISAPFVFFMQKTKRRKSTKRRKAVKRKSLDFKSLPKRKTIVISAVLLLALCVLLSAVFAPHGRKLPNPLPELGKYVALGVDISEHNGTVDWYNLKDEADFALIRVGYTGYASGKICLDKNFKDNIKQANSVGMPVGVYYYTQATDKKEAKQEAKFVLHELRNYDISLPVFIDFEYAQADGEFVGRLYDSQLSSDECIDIINEFCTVIEKEGYSSGVYASADVMSNNINMKSLNADSYIWVAHYAKNLGYKGDFDVWQYTDKGESDCVESDYVDMNYWYLV